MDVLSFSSVVPVMHAFGFLPSLRSRLSSCLQYTHNTSIVLIQHSICIQSSIYFYALLSHLVAPSIHSFPLLSSSSLFLSAFLQILPILSGTHPQQPVRGEAVEDPELHSHVDKGYLKPRRARPRTSPPSCHIHIRRYMRTYLHPSSYFVQHLTPPCCRSAGDVA